MASSPNPDAEKAERERAAFKRFLSCSKLPIDLDSVVSRLPPEPDIYCVGHDGTPMTFELAELCDSIVAKTFADLIELGGIHAKANVNSDPTTRIYVAKIAKSYRTDLPVDLLMYVDQRLVTEDDVILPTLEHLIRLHEQGPFRRIWFFGEEICCLVDPLSPD
jgi:hypothetical protein